VNIIERGRGFVESLRAMAGRSVWVWRRCGMQYIPSPRCKSDETQRYGSYVRYPWVLAGREEAVVRCHLCLPCNSTYSEQSP